MADENASASRSRWPVIAAALFLALFAGVYVWRVSRDIPKIQADKRADACRRNLRAFYTAARSYYSEFDKYDEDLFAIGFIPADDQHAYIASRTGPYAMTEAAAGEKGLIGTLTLSQVAAAVEQASARGSVPGIWGACPNCEIVMLCISQLDGDGAFDIWSVSTEYRTRGGVTVEAGEVLHDVDDATE